MGRCFPGHHAIRSAVLQIRVRSINTTAFLIAKGEMEIANLAMVRVEKHALSPSFSLSLFFSRSTSADLIEKVTILCSAPLDSQVGALTHRSRAPT